VTAVYVRFHVVAVRAVRRGEDDSLVLESLEVDRYVVGVRDARRTHRENQVPDSVLVERHHRRIYAQPQATTVILLHYVTPQNSTTFPLRFHYVFVIPQIGSDLEENGSCEQPEENINKCKCKQSA